MCDQISIFYLNKNVEDYNCENVYSIKGGIGKIQKL